MAINPIPIVNSTLKVIGNTPMLDKNYYDAIRVIKEEDAKIMARRLAKEEGLFSGISIGLNVVGALKLARELGPGHTVVTMAVDTILK
jgi:cysteine synthase A